MKTINDKKIIILGAILLVFTIGYFVIINKVSYAFVNDYDPDKAYKETIDIIKKSAVVYGKNNPDLFQEEDTVYKKVQDLIDANLLVPNEEGNVINPLKEEETLNNNVIKIKKEKDKITVEVDS